MARKSRKAALLAQEPQMQERKVFRVGIYCRLSCEANERRESDSLQHQREICMEYLKDKTDMLLIEVYIDNGTTGTNFDRPAFQRLLSDIQQNRIDCVIAKDLSRFGRNYLDVEEYLNLKFPQWGVRFISVLDHFDTIISDSAGYLIVPFRNILNEFYARDFSQKVRTALYAKMKNGEYVASPVAVPYGYKGDDERKHLVIDPEAARTVQRIFQWRAEGKSTIVIADQLNREGIPSPNRYKYLKGIHHMEQFANCLWSSPVIYKMLHNPIYLGCRIYHKNIKNVADGEELCFGNAHEPLISAELFEQVQITNRKNAKPPAKKARSIEASFDYRLGLKGLCYCGDCGSHMIFEATSGHCDPRYYSLQCHRYKLYKESCTGHRFSMKKLIELIEGELNRHIALMDGTPPPPLLETDSRMNEAVQLRQKKQSILVRRRSLSEKKSQLLLDYMSEVLDKEEYIYIKEQYEAAETALEQELDAVQARLDTIQELRSDVTTWRDILSSFQQNGRVTNEMLKQLIERIVFFERDGTKEVKITFRYQDIFERMKEGLNHGDSE